MKAAQRSMFGRVALVGAAIVIITVAVWVGVSSLNAGGATAEVPSQVRNYTLYVRSTYLTMPDGEQVWTYGYTDDPAGAAQIPGPTLRANEGDTVSIRLVNDQDPTKTSVAPIGDGHTIHVHGIDSDTSNDGDPMTAPDTQPVLPGQVYTYTFVAKQAGTYWYHCHEAIVEHLQMGMYGAFIVGPKGGGKYAYDNGPAYDKEYTFVLSDLDSHLHAAIDTALHQGGSDPNWSSYHANYFLINGKAAPDTMSDSSDTISAKVGERILVRLINAGTQSYPIHLHGFHFQVIATDGYPMKQPLTKDSLDVAPGERYDIMFTPDKTGEYALHSNDPYQLTNDGQGDGGMTTMVDVADQNGALPTHTPRIKSKAALADELSALNEYLDAVSAAAAKGDWSDALKQDGYLSAHWDGLESDVRNYSREAYKQVEDKLTALNVAIKQAQASPSANAASAVQSAVSAAKDQLLAVTQ